jgi:hypothetical protein
MKKSVIIFMMMFTIIVYSQKKKNGTIFIEHPAINVVEDMLHAFFVEGDSSKVASLLADDFKSFSGTSINPNDKGRDKSNFLGGVKWFKNNVDYISYERSSGAYPDALDYKDDDDDDDAGLWVQTWDQFTGVNNKTGVKLDMPIHRLFKLSKDNKIRLMFTYDNDLPWAELRQSFVERKNGTIYNHHENINTVRKVIRAFEHSDFETAYKYFTDNARFSNSETPRGKALTLDGQKEEIKKIREVWDVESFDLSGYPDYLEYELGNGKVAQSWWTIRLVRKSDSKKFELPILYIHNFNDEGKITRQMAYYSSKVLED